MSVSALVSVTLLLVGAAFVHCAVFFVHEWLLGTCNMQHACMELASVEWLRLENIAVHCAVCSADMLLLAVQCRCAT